MSKDAVISKETAERQLQEFLEYYELDDLDDDEGVDIGPLVKKLRKAFQRGRLEFSEHGGRRALIQHLKHPPKGRDSQLVWRALTGTAKLAIKVKEDASQSMMLVYKFAAAITETDENLFVQLEDKDLTTAETCAAVFMQM